MSLRDAGQHLAKLNVAIMGISPDKPNTQKKFDEKNDLGYPLLSDPDHKVAERYGVWNQEDNFFKKLLGVTRSSFLIDETGKIMAALVQNQPPRHRAGGIKDIRVTYVTPSSEPGYPGVIKKRLFLACSARKG